MSCLQETLLLLQHCAPPAGQDRQEQDHRSQQRSKFAASLQHEVIIFDLVLLMSLD